MAVYSEHGTHSAYWFGLNTGQGYRLRLRVWEQPAQEPCPSQGTLICNEWDFQQLIEQAGGAAGCFKAISLPVSSTLLCDFTTVPSSLQDMYVELRLLALNNHSLGEPFKLTVHKGLSNAQVSLLLAYT